MFKKLIVVDAKGHLLGRLASYIAKALLSGIYADIQDRESLLSDARVSISPAPSSETKSNSPSFSERDYLPTPAELSSITAHPPESSGEPSGACSPIKPPEEPLLSAD